MDRDCAVCRSRLGEEWLQPPCGHNVCGPCFRQWCPPRPHAASDLTDVCASCIIPGCLRLLAGAVLHPVSASVTATAVEEQSPPAAPVCPGGRGAAPPSPAAPEYDSGEAGSPEDAPAAPKLRAAVRRPKNTQPKTYINAPDNVARSGNQAGQPATYYQRVTRRPEPPLPPPPTAPAAAPRALPRPPAPPDAEAEATAAFRAMGEAQRMLRRLERDSARRLATQQAEPLVEEAASEPGAAKRGRPAEAAGAPDRRKRPRVVAVDGDAAGREAVGAGCIGASSADQTGSIRPIPKVESGQDVARESAARRATPKHYTTTAPPSGQRGVAPVPIKTEPADTEASSSSPSSSSSSSSPSPRHHSAANAVPIKLEQAPEWPALPDPTPTCTTARTAARARRFIDDPECSDWGVAKPTNDPPADEKVTNPGSHSFVPGLPVHAGSSGRVGSNSMHHPARATEHRQSSLSVLYRFIKSEPVETDEPMLPPATTPTPPSSDLVRGTPTAQSSGGPPPALRAGARLRRFIEESELCKDGATQAKMGGGPGTTPLTLPSPASCETTARPWLTAPVPPAAATGGGDAAKRRRLFLDEPEYHPAPRAFSPDPQEALLVPSAHLAPDPPAKPVSPVTPPLPLGFISRPQPRQPAINRPAVPAGRTPPCLPAAVADPPSDPSSFLQPGMTWNPAEGLPSASLPAAAPPSQPNTGSRPPPPPPLPSGPPVPQSRLRQAADSTHSSPWRDHGDPVSSTASTPPSSSCAATPSRDPTSGPEPRPPPPRLPTHRSPAPTPLQLHQQLVASTVATLTHRPPRNGRLDFKDVFWTKLQELTTDSAADVVPELLRLADRATDLKDVAAAAKFIGQRLGHSTGSTRLAAWRLLGHLYQAALPGPWREELLRAARPAAVGGFEAPGTTSAALGLQREYEELWAEWQAALPTADPLRQCLEKGVAQAKAQRASEAERQRYPLFHVSDDYCEVVLRKAVAQIQSAAPQCDVNHLAEQAQKEFLRVLREEEPEAKRVLGIDFGSADAKRLQKAVATQLKRARIPVSRHTEVVDAIRQGLGPLWKEGRFQSKEEFRAAAHELHVQYRAAGLPARLDAAAQRRLTELVVQKAMALCAGPRPGAAAGDGAGR